MAAAHAADVQPLMEESSLEAESSASASTSRRVRMGLGATVLGGVAVLFVSRSAPSVTSGSIEGLTMLKEEKVEKKAAAVEQKQCSAKGENCLDPGCCIDGGDGGLQCYKRNDDYAECYEVDACEPGTHEGETHHSWNVEDNAWELDKWSCKAVGEKSRPGCGSFKKEGVCPDDRCAWGGKKCRAKCSILPSVGACWDAGHCMWESDKCQDACWEVEGENDCTALSRCQWLTDDKGGHCNMACHVHGDKDCPGEEKCMVENGVCKKDPCSAQWEDCRETKCCSAARGAQGMTCFEKDATYATCMDYLDPKYQKNWTGNKLGNRTKWEAGCSWAGQECSQTHACCNEGYNCAVKDDTFAGCAQNMKISTFNRLHIDLPTDWDGTVLGGWRGEYEVQPAAEGGDVAGMSLYCIMVVLPDSGEVELLSKAKDNNASIFQCEAHKVYNSWKTDAATWGETAETTVVNTDVFLHVMGWVRDDGDYLKHDWTVKVDPDCVFLAQRLKDHMWGLRPPPNTAIYMKNNNVVGMGNQNFLGAIEVFSKRAIQIYLDNDQDCGKYLGTNSGEDGFFKGCMDALGVGFMWDRNMFKPNFDPAICTNGKYAAYHPIKYPEHWQRCWDIATGKMCQDVTFDCGGPLNPPISSAGIR